MTSETAPTVAADVNDPRTLVAIPEDAKDDDRPAGEEMEVQDEETTEKPILVAHHIVTRFVGNDKQLNVAFLLKSVAKWLSTLTQPCLSKLTTLIGIFLPRKHVL
jgi:hypothetical protein